MASPQSFTKTIHNTSYPFIDPTSRSDILSCSGKTVIITGAAAGSLGGATALSFARAGATNIALIGRTESTLQQTKSNIGKESPSTNVFVAVADVSDAESIGKAAHAIRAECGAWDVFVHSAAFVPALTLIRGADEDDWWRTFEVNVRPLQFISRHFLTKCRTNATFINVSASSAYATYMLPKTSAYSASKIAAARVCDFIAAENESIGLKVFDIHPGVYDTPMFEKVRETLAPGEKHIEGVDMDDISLAANFFVWCASSEAEFLKGRHLWAKWDAEELIRRKQEIESSPTLLKLSLDCGS